MVRANGLRGWGLKSSPSVSLKVIVNKKISFLILASIFLVPISTVIPMQGTIVWYPQFLCLLCIGFGALSLNLWKFNKALSLLSLYILFSYIFVCNQNSRSLICLVACYAGLYIAYFSSKFKSSSTAMKCIAVMAGLQLLLVILQCAHKDPFFKPFYNDYFNGIVGFVGSHNQLAIYSATVTPILYSINPFLIIISLIPLVLVKTSSALIALFMGGLLYLLLNHSKKLAAIMFVSTLLISMAWFKYDSNAFNAFEERARIWNLTYDQITHGRVYVNITESVKKAIPGNSFTGFGLGSFMSLSPASQNDLLKNVNHRYEHAHNDLLEALFEFGYIGLSLILFCIFTVIKDFVVTYRSMFCRKNMVILFISLFVISICSLGVYVFHAPTTYFMFMLILGLLYGEIDYAKQSKISTQASSVN